MALFIPLLIVQMSEGGGKRLIVQTKLKCAAPVAVNIFHSPETLKTFSVLEDCDAIQPKFTDVTGK